MNRILLALFLISIVAIVADARHRHQHRRGRAGAQRIYIAESGADRRRSSNVETERVIVREVQAKPRTRTVYVTKAQNEDDGGDSGEGDSSGGSSTSSDSGETDGFTFRRGSPSGLNPHSRARQMGEDDYDSNSESASQEGDKHNQKNRRTVGMREVGGGINWPFLAN